VGRAQYESDQPAGGEQVYPNPVPRRLETVRRCLKSSTGILPVERRRLSGPRWPCDTWAGCPCYLGVLT
jgi:hypothetical protein